MKIFIEPINFRLTKMSRSYNRMYVVFPYIIIFLIEKWFLSLLGIGKQEEGILISFVSETKDAGEQPESRHKSKR